MRLINFRAWDKQIEKMIPVHSLDTVNEFASYWDYEKRYSTQGEDMPVILMQYIGLRDKSGNEIFDGDLVKVKIQGGYSTHFTDIEHIKVVKYDEKKACWKPFNVCHLWRDESGEFTAIEVIGNIYEHPHLLKESTL